MTPQTAAVRLLAGDKEPVRAATTANISLSGLLVIDGLTMAAGDRVLVKDQTDATANGIYTASVGTWLRAPDANASRTLIGGMKVSVFEGTVHGGDVWSLATDRPDVGDDDIQWNFYLSANTIADINQAAVEFAAAADEILATAWAATNAADYASRAAASLLSVPVALTYLRTAGYYAAGDGGGALYKKVVSEPTHAGKFQSSDGAWWEIVTAGSGVNAKAFGAKGDGVTDDTAAIQASVDYADGQPVRLPAGTYSVSEIKRLTSTSSQWRTGMKLIGDGRSTNLVARSNNKAVLLWDVGYTPTGTTTGTLKFTRDSEVRNLLITQAGGLTGVDGIKLTAAWNVRMSNVWVEGMSGKALHVPFRADIYAAVSDYWQCFALEWEHCRFSESVDWGVYLGGGQSPGLWRMQFCTIANNVGGGVYDTTGQFTFTDNLIVGNGTFGANGGMLIDASIEAVSFNALIERNEFDTNFNYHLWMMRVRNARIIGNRFLSQTYNSDIGPTLTSGSLFMRPATHVKLGDGATDEVWNSLFDRNYHRTITGAGPTTAAVSAYIMTSGSTQVVRNLFVNNDIGFRDGVNQNSSGMVRYNGINVGSSANSVVEGNKVGLSVSATSATSIAGTMTPVTFGTTIFDTHTGFASPNFTVPVPGRYRVSATIQINGLSVGNIVTLAVFVNGTQSRATQHYAGLAAQSFSIDADILLADTDIVSIRAMQNSGSGKNTTADSSTRLQIGQES